MKKLSLEFIKSLSPISIDLVKNEEDTKRSILFNRFDLEGLKMVTFNDKTISVRVEKDSEFYNSMLNDTNFNQNPLNIDNFVSSHCFMTELVDMINVYAKSDPFAQRDTLILKK